MDFARKQLEKYGWTDGKGLGKHENGISEALKPKLKRSVTGVGHDAAKDFTEHWWTQLYDKAAGNVQVKEKNGKTRKIKTKDDKFKITNNTWRLQQKSQNTGEDSENGYGEYFVKKAVLTSGGSKTERVRDSDSEEEKEAKDVFKMTDEELFAACEGRTAHKGARHGLKALGKLARIERQEQTLLTQPQYNGYSHVKKIKTKASVTDLQVVEDINLNSDDGAKEIKRKEKRKRCINNTSIVLAMENEMNMEEGEQPLFEVNNAKKMNSDASDKKEKVNVKKLKKSKRKFFELDHGDEEISKSKIKSSAHIEEINMETEEIVNEEQQDSTQKVKKNKKKKLKHLVS